MCKSPMDVAALSDELQRLEQVVAARSADLDRRGAKRDKAHDDLLAAKRAAKRAERKADDAVAALRDAVTAREAAAKALRKASGGAACYLCGKAGDGDLCKTCDKAICGACAQPCGSCGAALCAHRDGAASCASAHCGGCKSPICCELACVAPKPCTCSIESSRGEQVDLQPQCTGCGWVAELCGACGGGLLV